MEHPGGGVAPWNVQQYKITGSDGAVCGEAIATGFAFPVVFYHYHSLAMFRDGTVNLCWYPLPKNTVELIYRPYVKALLAAGREVAAVAPGLDPHGLREHEFSRLGRMLRGIRRRMKRTYNFHDIGSLAGE